MLQQQCNRVGKVETGSVALPAIMRSGAGGPESFQMGSMPQAKQHITSGQMHRGHMAPLVTSSALTDSSYIDPRFSWFFSRRHAGSRGPLIIPKLSPLLT